MRCRLEKQTTGCFSVEILVPFKLPTNNVHRYVSCKLIARILMGVHKIVEKGYIHATFHLNLPR